MHVIYRHHDIFGRVEKLFELHLYGCGGTHVGHIRGNRKFLNAVL